MIKILLAFALILISVNSFAQQYYEVPRHVICAPTPEVFANLTGDDIGETPIWIGTGETGKTQVTIFMNMKSGTFTVIEFTKNFACVLSVGNKSEILLGNHL